MTSHWGQTETRLRARFVLLPKRNLAALIVKCVFCAFYHGSFVKKFATGKMSWRSPGTGRGKFIIYQGNLQLD